MKHLFTMFLFGMSACTFGETSSGSPAAGDVSSPVDCTSSTTKLDQLVCQASGFLGTLSSTELATANPAFTDAVSRTKWSNFPAPVTARAGIQLTSLGAASQAAAMALMASVLTSDGLSDLAGVRAADDYLAATDGSTAPGGGAIFGSQFYYISVFGTPSATGDWSLMFTGHHTAYIVTVTGGVAYPTPNHIGVEPKAPFTINGSTYEPMGGESAALVAIFNALSATQLATAYLTGQTFSDVLVGPVEYMTGSSALAKAKFPTGANRTGVLASALSTAQQALVTAAIKQWVADFDPTIADGLIAAYTSDAAFANTYVAWAGPQSGTGVNVDAVGEYMRIDGPRVWIELACNSQNGAATHYHTIYRDKSLDYANTL